MLITLLSSLASAAPMQLTHTGRVMDAAGLPLSGPHDVHVRLYASGSGGASLWDEQQTLDFDNGYFSVLLGADTVGNAIQLAVLDGDSLYVGVTIDGGTEVGRQQVVSVPYAMRAEDVEGVMLEDLPCSADQIPLYDGSDWGCAAAASATTAWSDLTGVPPELLDGDDVLDEAAVDAFVANNGFALLGDLATVATTGAYGDLSGIPALATVATTGDYADLSGTPTLSAIATSGSYADLSGAPVLATVATSGDYGDLTGTPTLSAIATSGAWTDLQGVPAGFADGVDNDTIYTDVDAVAAIVADGSFVQAGAPIDDLRVGTGAAVCDATSEGALRWNGSLQICDGTEWRFVPISGVKNGSIQENAGDSCKQIHDDHPSLASGNYWLDPDADGDTTNAFPAWCEMSVAGGGWTLAGVISSQDGIAANNCNQTWDYRASIWTDTTTLNPTQFDGSADMKSQAWSTVAFTELMSHETVSGVVGYKSWDVGAQAHLSSLFSQSCTVLAASPTASGGTINSFNALAYSNNVLLNCNSDYSHINDRSRLHGNDPANPQGTCYNGGWGYGVDGDTNCSYNSEARPQHGGWTNQCYATTTYYTGGHVWGGGSTLDVGHFEGRLYVR